MNIEDLKPATSIVELICDKWESYTMRMAYLKDHYPNLPESQLADHISGKLAIGHNPDTGKDIVLDDPAVIATYTESLAKMKSPVSYDEWLSNLQGNDHVPAGCFLVPPKHLLVGMFERAIGALPTSVFAACFVHLTIFEVNAIKSVSSSMANGLTEMQYTELLVRVRAYNRSVSGNEKNPLDLAAMFNFDSKLLSFLKVAPKVPENVIKWRGLHKSVKDLLFTLFKPYPSSVPEDVIDLVFDQSNWNFTREQALYQEVMRRHMEDDHKWLLHEIKREFPVTQNSFERFDSMAQTQSELIGRLPAPAQRLLCEVVGPFGYTPIEVHIIFNNVASLELRKWVGLLSDTDFDFEAHKETLVSLFPEIMEFLPKQGPLVIDYPTIMIE